MADEYFRNVALKTVLEEFSVSPREAAEILGLSEQYVRNACSTGSPLREDTLKHLIDILVAARGFYTSAPAVIAIPVRRGHRGPYAGLKVISCPFCGRSHLHENAHLGPDGTELPAGCEYGIHPQVHLGYRAYPVGDLTATNHELGQHSFEILKEDLAWAKDSAL